MNRNLAAISIFAVSVLLLTRLDFLINNIFYSFGLTFSQDWYHEYLILYFLAYQLVILALLGLTRNLKLTLFFEVFVLTSTQDLVYFGLWQGGFPAHEWTWVIQYRIFGFWNTATQLVLSSASLASTIILSWSVKIPVWIRTSTVVKSFSSTWVRSHFDNKTAEEL